MKKLMISTILGAGILTSMTATAQMTCESLIEDSAVHQEETSAQALAVLSRQVKEKAWSFRQEAIDPLFRMTTEKAYELVESRHLRSRLDHLVSEIRRLTEIAIEEGTLTAQTETDLESAYSVLRYPLYTGRNHIYERVGLQMINSDHDALWNYLVDSSKIEKREAFRQASPRVKLANRKAEILKNDAIEIAAQINAFSQNFSHQVINRVFMSSRSQFADEQRRLFSAEIQPQLDVFYVELMKEFESLDPKNKTNLATREELKNILYIVRNVFSRAEWDLNSYKGPSDKAYDDSLGKAAFNALIVDSKK